MKSLSVLTETQNTTEEEQTFSETDVYRDVMTQLAVETSTGFYFYTS